MIYRFSVNSVDDNDPELGGESGNFDGFRSDIEREYPSVQQHDEESADLIADQIGDTSGNRPEVSVFDVLTVTGVDD